MTLTKTLLREELTIFNEKLKLTKETLILIENPDYVKYVLGINVSLNENQSFETKRLILQEAFNIQGLAKSIVQKYGDKINTIVNGVKDLDDVGRIIYLIIQDKTGTFAKKALDSLTKSVNAALKRFQQQVLGIEKAATNTIGDLTAQLGPIVTQLTTLTNKILGNYTGITGVLALLGLATVLLWLEEKVLSTIQGKIKDFFKDSIINKIKKVLDSFGEYFKKIFTNLTINTITGFFSTFNSILGGLVIASDIMGILSFLLEPVIERFDFRKY